MRIRSLTFVNGADERKSATIPAEDAVRFKTEYWQKPIPARNYDWSAWVDDTADEGMLIGYGPTEEAAIEDLKLGLGELVECGSCGARVEPEALKEREDSDPDTGYSATEEYCSHCDPAKRANEREAAAEAAFWSGVKEF